MTRQSTATTAMHSEGLRSDLEHELSRFKALLTVKEAISTGYVTADQIYSHGTSSGRRRVPVPIRRVGGRIFIPKAEFIEWLCEGCKEKPL